MRSCWRTQRQPFYGCLAFEAKWRGEKAGYMDVSWTDQKSKEIIILKCYLLLFYAIIMKHFSIGLWQKLDFIQKPTQWLDGEEAPKHFTKPNLHQKKRVMVTVRWSVDSLIHYSSLNPGKSITSVKYAQKINKMHWKRQCLYPALVKWKGQILHNNALLHVTQIMLQKLIWTMKFGLICHIHLTSPQPTTTSSIISKTLCRENAFTTSRTQKMLSKSSSNPEACFFLLQEQTYLSLAKMCWL